jgi:hypothetical protein
MERQRVEQWFADGTLIRPRAAGEPTSVDLIRAIAALADAPDVPLSAAAQSLTKLIHQATHHLMVIVDGLGTELLSRHAPSGFFADRLATRIEAVFPSTTAAALTSLYTGAYPAEHAIPGWWIYLDELNISGVSLPFVDRASGKDLQLDGVRPQQVFTAPSLLPRMRRDAAVVTLKPFVASAYSTYSSGGCTRIGYERISEGIDATIQRLHSAAGPTFTQLYLPQLDELCHHRGVEGEPITQMLRGIESEIQRLRRSLPADARIVITADHGHVNLPPAQRIVLSENDEMLGELRALPSGEPAVPVFHVRPGRAQRFAELFRQRLGQQYALLSIDEVDAMRLLGPQPLTPLARRRFGDFIGITPQPRSLRVAGDPGHQGIHAGLTPGEMFVPLILA